VGKESTVLSGKGISPGKNRLLRQKGGDLRLGGQKKEGGGQSVQRLRASRDGRRGGIKGRRERLLLWPMSRRRGEGEVEASTVHRTGLGRRGPGFQGSK